jgi:hypothetical protein
MVNLQDVEKRFAKLGIMLEEKGGSPVVGACAWVLAALRRQRNAQRWRCATDATDR